MRPDGFETFIGNAAAVATLKVATFAAINENRSLPHTLFVGPAGVGKTTLARIVCSILNTNFVPCVGNSLDSSEKIVDRAINTGFRGILFVDEIHGMPPAAQNFLLTLLEDFSVQAADRMIQVPPFTVIGATTDPMKLNKPFKDRFAYKIYLETYDATEVSHIIRQNIGYATYDEEAITLLTDISRGIARRAVSFATTLLKDFCSALEIQHITTETIQQMMAVNGIYPSGLTRANIEYLKALCTYDNLSLSSLKDKLGAEQLADSEEIAKRMEFVDVTNKGRQITAKGRQYLWEVGAYG